HNVCCATINREVARAGRTDVSYASRRPAEQVLWPKIVTHLTKARPKTNHLIYCMLSRTLRIENTAARRTRKLIWQSRIKRNNPVVRAAVADVAVCKHRCRRVQPYCSTIRTRGSNNRRQCTTWEGAIRKVVAAGCCICYERIEASVPCDQVDCEIAL